MAGAAFGDVAVSFFVAGAAFGDVAVSLFLAGAAFGDIWVDSRSAKRCNFHYKMRLQSATSNLGERAGDMVRSRSDRPRIVNRFRQISPRFGSAILGDRRSIW